MSGLKRLISRENGVVINVDEELADTLGSGAWESGAKASKAADKPAEQKSAPQKRTSTAKKD